MGRLAQASFCLLIVRPGLSAGRTDLEVNPDSIDFEAIVCTDLENAKILKVCTRKISYLVVVSERADLSWWAPGV